jgi:hypothetical protein
MDTAEAASAFFFAGKENLKVGFNVVNCDTLGNCKVLSGNTSESVDSIAIQLGDRSTPIFNFPQAQSVPFFTSPQANSPSDDTSGFYTKGTYDGKYACSCDTVNNVIEVYDSPSDKYYMQLLNYGFLPFQSIDSETFFYDSLGLSVQVRFVDETDSTAPNKLIVTIQNQAGNINTQRLYFPFLRNLSGQESTNYAQMANGLPMSKRSPKRLP